eukprot:4529621-Pyramimonas_sp.AAC.1
MDRAIVWMLSAIVWMLRVIVWMLSTRPSNLWGPERRHVAVRIGEGHRLFEGGFPPRVNPGALGQRLMLCNLQSNRSPSNLNRNIPHTSTNHSPSIGICLKHRPIAVPQ